MAQELIPIFHCEPILRPGVLLVLQFQGSQHLRAAFGFRDRYWPIEFLGSAQDVPVFSNSIPLIADELTETRVVYRIGSETDLYFYKEEMVKRVVRMATELNLPYSIDGSLKIFSHPSKGLTEGSLVQPLTSTPALSSPGRG